MNHWLVDYPATLVLGHRGACAHYPENTLGSLKLSHTQGAHGTEFDVKLSKDGHVVLMHDTTVDRTTNGTGNTHELTLAQLRALNAGLGEQVPTLHEVLDAFTGATAMLDTPGGSTSIPFLINIEVTNYATQGDGLEAAVAEVVRAHPNAIDQVMYSSFSPQTLALLMQHTPEIPRGFLHHPKFHGAMHGVDLGALKLTFEHPHFSTVTAQETATRRAKGIRINTWTVNEPDVMRAMVAAKVAGIMGDSPVLMRRVLAEPRV